MKNSKTRNEFQNMPIVYGRNILDNKQENHTISPKAANCNMTEQTVMPPARVWEKIERILDEQDNRRKQADRNSIFLSKTEVRRRKNALIAAFAGVSVLAGLFWKVF